jgi:hypothetical protein
MVSIVAAGHSDVKYNLTEECANKLDHPSLSSLRTTTHPKASISADARCKY